ELMRGVHATAQPKTIVYGEVRRHGTECLPQTLVVTTKRQGLSAGLPMNMRARNGSEESS
ncbi:MAG: hypothetical protein ACTH8F_17440, partial [Microbacterium sp.]|uniref:hypothetical protein n=1 Tax=Microbacterium sp. TaxID=51671 RepID=UPI003F998D9C